MPPEPDIDHAATEAAAQALRQGKLVAFPTETVYGLGADAENAAAVGRIFAVKGRPSNHPLIVHIASADELERWAVNIPAAAWRLAEACWPGPLTLLLHKSERVPAETTGGLPSVGLRVPAHPVALELLRRFGGGVAAPSANRFGRVSPTCAEHVRQDLGSDVDVVLDGGDCQVGVESTIIDLTHGTPVLLRPGGVSAERIQSLLGSSVERHIPEGVRAPGLLASHYAPRAMVELVVPTQLTARARALSDAGERVAVLVMSSDDHTALRAIPRVTLLDLGATDDVAAQRLYSALRQADVVGAGYVLATDPTVRREPSVGGEPGERSERHERTAALADRLTKAAGPRQPL